MSGLFDFEVDDEVLSELRSVLSGMSSVVSIEIIVGDNEGSRAALKLLEAIRNSSPVIGGSKAVEVKVSRAPGEARTPIIKMVDGRLRFVGAPVGEEFKTIVESIIRISNKDSGLSREAREKLKSVRGRRLIQVIVTPPCPYCPYASLYSLMIAYESYLNNGGVEAEVIEAFENPDIADSYGVTTVPAIIIDGELAYVGVPTDVELVEMLLEKQSK